MQIRSKSFGTPNNPSIPAVQQELHLQLDALQPHLAILMRTYGIATIQLNIKPAIPISDVQLLKKDMDLTYMPIALRDVRHRILKNIKDLMLVYGLYTISIALSDEEWSELIAYWKYLSTGKTVELDDIQFKNVPLHFEVDPVRGAMQVNDAQTH